MKPLFFVTVLSLSLLSCKSTKHADCDAYSLNSFQTSDSLTKLEKIQKSLDEDAMVISTWTQEEKDYFYKNFVFTSEELEKSLNIKLK